MEKINVAELLKDCPKGMELDCTIFSGLEFDRIDENNGSYPIICRTKTTNGKYHVHTFTKHGCYSTEMYSKCVIYPKDETTWEGFVPPCKFKGGDVVCCKDESRRNQLFIIKEYRGNDMALCYLFLDTDGTLDTDECVYNIDGLATEEEKQKLFQAIKDNGYKWNAETKTLEKLIEPKFKVGDKITDGNKFIYRITEITDKGYKLHDLRTTFVTFEEADLYFVKVVGVFDITTLKPFDKILVRDANNTMWIAALFSHLREMRFYTVSTWYNQCIPFEGNQHLLGTTNDCDEFYKTWTSEED